MHNITRAMLAAVALAASAPAFGENWQQVAKGDKISSFEVDKDSLQLIHNMSSFRIRLTYAANSLPPWKGDTLVATAILGCDGSIPLSFDHLKYYRDGKEVGGALVAQWPDAAPPLPSEAVSVVCAAPPKQTAAINWRSFGTAAGAEFFFDPDSVKPDGSRRSLRMKDVLSTRYDVMSAVVDCSAGVVNIESVDMYSPDGTLKGSEKNAGSIKIEAGMPFIELQKLICT